MNDAVDMVAYERRARVARLISRAQIEITDALDVELAPFDMTAAQFVIVAMLATDRADSAAQICKHLSYNPGAMTRMLDRMEKKGILKRQRNKEDRRTILLVLTEHGTALYPKLLVGSSRVLERFFGGFSKEELTKFEGLMQRAVLGG